MKQLVKNNKNGGLKIIEMPPPVNKKGHVLVKNIYSAVSIGTESSSIRFAEKNLVGKALERSEEFKKVINLMKTRGIYNAYKIAMNKLELPSTLGYSTVGEIIDFGKNVKGFEVGDRVACGGAGYAIHAEVISVPINLCVKVPSSVDLEEASFATIGSIALQGVRQAKVSIGENIVVIGLGLIGLITIQLLQNSGCKVIGIDVDQRKVDFAVERYAVKGCNSNAPALREILFSETRGHGSDSVIITASTSGNDVIELASQVVRDRGSITVVGGIKMDLPRAPFYDKELTLNLSRSYGPGRYDRNYEEKGIDYPIGFVRWTENRNMEAFIDLLQRKILNIRSLITHSYKFEDAKSAYEGIIDTEEFVIGASFEYNNNPDMNSKHTLSLTQKNFIPKNKELNVGMIGAGSYAQDKLLPSLKSIKRLNFVGLATASGSTAKHIGEKYGFEFITTEFQDIIESDRINSIIIATRHNLHSDQVVLALESNKHVFVEKPLAIKQNEITKIIKAYKESKGSLMVGFNRRYSPFTDKVIDFFRDINEPMAINYRVNSGYQSKNNWSQDPEEGGGRIVGEACHFVDFCNYVIRSKIVDLNVHFADTECSDTCNISLKYLNGSIANISYFSNGDQAMEKERIEFFSGNSCAVINDFLTVDFNRDGEKSKFKVRSQDKGQRNMMNRYAKKLLTTGRSLIPFEDLISLSEILINIENKSVFNASEKE